MLTRLIAIALFMAPSIAYGQSADVAVAKIEEDLPSLTASMQFSGEFNFKVTTQAKFVGYLISNDGLSKLDEADKWQVSVYEYSYLFENTSSVKMKVLFSNRDVLISPLVDLFKAYSITLEPGKAKTVSFIANTKPQEAYGGNIFVALWSEENQQWFIASAGSASLYVPRFNAFYQKTFEQGRQLSRDISVYPEPACGELIESETL